MKGVNSQPPTPNLQGDCSLQQGGMRWHLHVRRFISQVHRVIRFGNWELEVGN